MDETPGRPTHTRLRPARAPSSPPLLAPHPRARANPPSFPPSLPPFLPPSLPSSLPPANSQVRPATGLDNVSYFVPGFWVWAKIVEALSAVGYDVNDLTPVPYDWRLSPAKLERRDGLLTRMKVRGAHRTPTPTPAQRNAARACDRTHERTNE